MSVAFVFPGQGSQYAGMGREFYQGFPEASSVYQRVDRALGFPLSELCFEGPGEELDLTVNTQPALLATSLACLEVFKKAGGLSPVAAAGHSLGEYTALVAAGSLSLEDAARLVRNRGRYMQEAVPVGTGGMAAILGLDGPAVEELCNKASFAGVIEAVNINCPGQVVVAGDMAGLAAVEGLAREAGARRFMRLSVSAPFHSSLMEPASRRLAEDLAGVPVAEAAFPVVANAGADFVRTAAEIRESLIKQVYSPVRWEESIRKMISSGVDTFVELGPGTVLIGLIKKISKQVQVYNIESGATLEKALALAREVG